MHAKSRSVIPALAGVHGAWYRVLMSRYRVTIDIGTSYREHKTRYWEITDIGTSQLSRYRVRSTHIRKIPISGVPISGKNPISGLSRIQMALDHIGTCQWTLALPGVTVTSGRLRYRDMITGIVLLWYPTWTPAVTKADWNCSVKCKMNFKMFTFEIDSAWQRFKAFKLVGTR